MNSELNRSLKARPVWVTAFILFACGVIMGETLSQIARKLGLF